MDQAAELPDGDGQPQVPARVRQDQRRPVVNHPGRHGQARALRALAGLSPPHREVVLEVGVRGRTLAEASAVLGIPVGAVKARLFHALHAFRERLLQPEC
jgi:DNA-directed RNA polymerase specialized sigma24 family protein